LEEVRRLTQVRLGNECILLAGRGGDVVMVAFIKQLFECTFRYISLNFAKKSSLSPAVTLTL
jgi:hypothetical protein